MSPNVLLSLYCHYLYNGVIFSVKENSKVKETYEVLMSFKSWLIKQQQKLDTMRPAAVLTAPLTDQITETDVRTLLVRILAIQ